LDLFLASSQQLWETNNLLDCFVALVAMLHSQQQEVINDETSYNSNKQVSCLLLLQAGKARDNNAAN